MKEEIKNILVKHPAFGEITIWNDIYENISEIKDIVGTKRKDGGVFYYGYITSWKAEGNDLFILVNNLHRIYPEENKRNISDVVTYSEILLDREFRIYRSGTLSITYM